MAPTRLRRGWRLTGALAAVALAGCSVAPDPPIAPPDPLPRLARSIGIIRSATPDRPKVLKLLFYGQSISTPAWTDQAVAQLRAEYPGVVFDVRNLALGGWSAPLLERATKRDVADVYPDLVVFHVYGDHHAYERIIRTIRSETAAEVIVQTDHVVEPVEPPCDEGIHLRWSPPPGCAGHIRFKQHVWSDFMSNRWIPAMAAKYGLAVEPRRIRWDAYLKAHQLPPMALIADAPHPNRAGWALMSRLFVSWFERLIDRPARLPPIDPPLVQSLAPPAPGASRVYQVAGNRIEALAGGPLDGKLTVTIDGKTPEAFDGCWQDSRVSRLPNLADWPAIKQVRVDPAYHRADLWNVRVHGLDPTQAAFAFDLTSDRGGSDGGGSAKEAFRSPSGRVTIEAEDWNLAYARGVSGKAVTEGTSFSWERRFVCTDRPPVSLPNGQIEQRHIFATGLANTRHVMKLAVARDAPPIAELRVYRPPSK